MRKLLLTCLAVVALSFSGIASACPPGNVPCGNGGTLCCK